MSDSFYSENEIKNLGLKAYGKNVLISRKCSIYSPDKIAIGNNVRIDDFCILSGIIELGSYIHISAYTALYGRFGIKMEDYSGLSPRCTVFSASDDFSGNFLVGPMVDPTLTNVTGGLVLIGKYVQIGAGSILLPNINISEGAAVGAMSLINKSLDAWKIYAGIPVKEIKVRSKKMLDYLK
jgi:galactoside O-acetyltransferase